MVSGKRRFYGVALAVVLASSCAKKSEESSEKEAAASDQQAQPTPSPAASPAPSPAVDATAVCWDKILKTPEATACTTLYTYSGKACVAGVTKVPSCTRETINASYGSATLPGGVSVMTSVDQWIKDGYEPNQCATGSDGKLYVYFLKKVFTAKASNTSGVDQYSIMDKRLGPAGAILSSITLQNSVTPAEFSCE